MVLTGSLNYSRCNEARSPRKLPLFQLQRRNVSSPVIYLAKLVPGVQAALSGRCRPYNLWHGTASCRDDASLTASHLFHLTARACRSRGDCGHQSYLFSIACSECDKLMLRIHAFLGPFFSICCCWFLLKSKWIPLHNRFQIRCSGHAAAQAGRTPGIYLYIYIGRLINLYRSGIGRRDLDTSKLGSC